MGERAKSTQCISPHIIHCSFIPYKVFITIYKAFHITPSSCHTIQSSFSLYWDSSQDAKHAKPIYNIQSHFTLYRASFTPYRDPLRYKELLHNMQTLYRVSTQYTKSFHIIQSPLRMVQVRAGPGYIILEHCTMLLHILQIYSHYTVLLFYSRGLPHTIAFSHHTQRVYIIQDSLQPRLTAILQEN